MGNCITFQRVVSWVDDGEWDFLEPETPRHSIEDNEQTTIRRSTNKDYSLMPYTESLSAAAKPKSNKPTQEVRIKISKKKLAELLRQAESKHMPVQDVLASIIEIGKPRVRHRIGQCWQPGLQSIPENIE